ncbi:carbon storage regulator [Aminipila terrae]|uniref:Translational regulator CsrA n=1 Tax=Aminipila terrae TaxID=2697030 RepID=A0A6P1MBD9_9FIRM|nr:carbon storage regulator [Aminipila terrae]QHI71940.1 carbon storage regulator [Aminipila terrae]
MLILTRKQGESFLLGEKIEISVSEINGDRVRIAIDAPKDVKILRKELKDAGDFNMESASATKIPTAETLSSIANLASKLKEKK